MVKRILPDTNIWSYWFRGNNTFLLEKMEKAFDHLILSSVVFSELCHGASKSGNELHLRKVLSLGEVVPVMDFKKEDAVIYGNMRSDLEKSGKMIGPYDLQIASQALRLSAVLVTQNQREFSRVQDLKIEDWTT